MRMGLVANEEIGRDPFGVEADINVEARPPRSCLVDGVQYATGCTLGKGNIRITQDFPRISGRFSRGARRVIVTLRDDVLRRLEHDLTGMPEEGIIDWAFEIMDTPAGDLFEVTR
jgi:formylmethanofuran dehydrogenase subunit E